MERAAPDQMDWRKWVTRVLITALPLAACATPAMTLTRQGEATISDATLSADGRTVTVTIRGGASPSSGAVCTGNYRLQDYEIDGDVLEAHGWAEEYQRVDTTGCALIELVCCEYKFDVPIDPPFSVRELRVPNPSNTTFPFLRKLLVRPPTIPTLANLDGWQLFREGSPLTRWPHWEQRYVPNDAANEDGMRLDLDAAIGGPVVSGHDSDSVTTAVKVNGIDATLNTYADTRELQLVWRMGDVSLALDATNTNFTADELIAIAEAAVPAAP